MKVIVLGAGIIGISTAYFLAKKGYEVVVIEKNSSCALGCSYANGGQLSYADINPLSSHNFLLPMLKAAIKPNSYLTIKDFNLDFLKWSREFFKNSSAPLFKANSLNLFFLSLKSKNALTKLLESETEIKFGYKEKGILHFFRNQKLFDEAIKQAEFRRSLGIRVEILRKEECVKKEPTLVSLYDQKKLLGGIFYPEDASGDSALFAKELEKICREKYAVVIKYDCDIKNIFTNYQKITGINTNKGVFIADKYVYALGAYSKRLLQGIQINSGIYPIKGYSLSIPANKEFLAPNLSLTDEENCLVYSRLNNIFRVAGTFEINNLKTNKNQSHINFLKQSVKSTFSDFGNLYEAKEWFGFRPFRANFIPLICQVKKYGNLYINSGHGHQGWTLAAASAEIITNLIAGQESEELKFLSAEEKFLYK
jgi:D-amino-acid dehydrogenase